MYPVNTSMSCSCLVAKLVIANGRFLIEEQDEGEMQNLVESQQLIWILPFFLESPAGNSSPSLCSCHMTHAKCMRYRMGLAVTWQLHHVAPCCTMLHLQIWRWIRCFDLSSVPNAKRERNREKERDFSLWKCSKAKRWLAMTRNCKMCVDRSRYPKYDCMFQRPSGFPWISLYTGMPVVGKCQHRLKLDSLRGSCRFCHVQIRVLLGWFVPGWNAPLIPLNKRCSIALKYSLRLVIDCWKMWKQIASNCHLRVWRFVDLNFGNGKVWSEEHLETM